MDELPLRAVQPFSFHPEKLYSEYSIFKGDMILCNASEYYHILELLYPTTKKRPLISFRGTCCCSMDF